MEIISVNAVGTPRRAVMGGREFLVADASLVVPGVLAGSNGPLYYPAEELSRDPSVWNGVPVVLGHPQEGGKYVSARAPGVLDRHELGRVFASRWSGKLAAEAWFDVALTRRLAPGVLNALESGRQVELSTGLYYDDEPAPDGSAHEGKPYASVARNYRPDHLAVLVDRAGACSVADGCGLNVNHAEGNPNMDREATVGRLAANCKCAGSKEALASLSDEALAALAANLDAAARVAAVKEKTGLDLLAANAAADPMAAMMTVCKEMMAAEEKADAQAMAGMAGNAAKAPPAPARPMTEAEWMQSAPAAIRGRLQYLAEIEQRERAEIVGRLAANAADDAGRSAAGAVYASLPLEQLRALASAMPAPAPAPQPQHYPAYWGAAGAPAANAHAEAALDLPAYEWKR